MIRFDFLAESVIDTLSVAKDLKAKILRIMGDKLVNSLSISNIDDVDKVICLDAI